MSHEYILSHRDNIVITHYGCVEFESESHEIYWIGCLQFIDGEKFYTFISDSNEVEMIERYCKYIQENSKKTFIHWSMNTPNFGFNAIESRYKKLTNNEIKLYPEKVLDLSEYLKSKYGVNYIDKTGAGRLNNLATLNDFKGLSETKEITSKKGPDRFELLYSIYLADVEGVLKVNQAVKQINPYPHIFVKEGVYQCFMEYMTNHIVEPLIDISYLKKRMEDLKLLPKITDKEFMLFLNQEVGVLNQTYYQKFIENQKLTSLKKSSTAVREQKFNLVFRAFL
jgi:hypothetical protein